MQTKSDSQTVPSGIREIARTFGVAGWLSFCVQLALIFVSSLTLLFAISGRNFSTEGNPGIGIGIFWAVSGIIVLCFTTYLAFRYTRIAKGLRYATPDARPKKVDTLRYVRLGIFIGLVGMLLTILGAGSTMGVLVAKSLSQTAGFALTDPNRIIRGLDVFVAVANLNGITAHFIGTVTSLWLLERLNSH